MVLAPWTPNSYWSTVRLSLALLMGCEAMLDDTAIKIWGVAMRI
jgi:hypothetical protein